MKINKPTANTNSRRNNQDLEINRTNHTEKNTKTKQEIIPKPLKISKHNIVRSAQRRAYYNIPPKTKIQMINRALIRCKLTKKSHRTARVSYYYQMESTITMKGRHNL